MKNDLLELAKVTQSYYLKNSELPEVVNPSIPIMYFGDYEAYLKSKIKIITVGLNPSNIEFQKDSKSSLSYFRFPKWENDKDYIGALNNYFETGKSYEKWFEMGFENVLNGLNASYYSKKEKQNIVLHTDIFTPIATNPTWTKLSSETKNNLQNEGLGIWKRLTEILKPDIILTALKKNDCNYIELKNKTDLIKIDYTKEGKKHQRPYSIQKAIYNNTYIIIGRTVNIPFGDISHEKKIEIGKLILADYNK
jgi:hypothetical protein